MLDVNWIEWVNECYRFKTYCTFVIFSLAFYWLLLKMNERMSGYWCWMDDNTGLKQVLFWCVLINESCLAEAICRFYFTGYWMDGLDFFSLHVKRWQKMNEWMMIKVWNRFLNRWNLIDQWILLDEWILILNRW